MLTNIRSPILPWYANGLVIKICLLWPAHGGGSAIKAGQAMLDDKETVNERGRSEGDRKTAVSGQRHLTCCKQDSRATNLPDTQGPIYDNASHNCPGSLNLRGLSTSNPARHLVLTLLIDMHCRPILFSSLNRDGGEDQNVWMGGLHDDAAASAKRLLPVSLRDGQSVASARCP